jgi:serine/threonine-protein kinase
MGTVWQARDTVLGRVVAVKVMLPALLSDPAFGSRFRAEARMMAALRHPNIVDVYDYGESSLPGGHVVYLVMAYVEGEPLSGRIAAAGRLPAEETMTVMAQAADALHAAHEGGIIHRDVKPGNLLIQTDGTVKLVDFGVARSTAVTAVTAADAVPGTALYMAPEQASGKPVSAATDVYALGVVAYHCLAGEPPFTGDTALAVAMRQLQDPPPPLPTDVPAEVRAVVMRSLEKDPGQRYASAESFAAAARAAVAASGSRNGAPGGVATVPASALGAGAFGAAGAGAAATGSAPTRLDLLGGQVAGPAAGTVGLARPSTEPTAPVGPIRPGGGGFAGGPAGDGFGDRAGGRRAAGGGGDSPGRRAVLAGGAALLLVMAAVLVTLGLINDDEDGSGDPPGTPGPVSSAPAQQGSPSTGPTRRTGSAPAGNPAVTTAPGAPATSAPGGGGSPPASDPAPEPSGGGDDDGSPNQSGAPADG